MRIRVVEAWDSDAAHTDIFSQLIGRRSPQLPLRELWIYIKQKNQKYNLPPLSKFPNVEKLVVRVTTNGNPIYRLFQDYVDEVEFSNEDEESHGVEFPAVCMMELGEWWEPWTKHQIWFL